MCKSKINTPRNTYENPPSASLRRRNLPSVRTGIDRSLRSLGNNFFEKVVAPYRSLRLRGFDEVRGVKKEQEHRCAPVLFW